MAEGKFTEAEIIENALNAPDITFVKDKDPNRFYYHAEDDELRILEMKRQGFRIEGEDDGAKPDSPAAVVNDGTSKVVNIPKHVLMSRPKRLHDAVVKAKRERFEDLAQREEEAAMKDARKAMDKIGVPGKLKRRLENIKKNY